MCDGGLSRKRQFQLKSSGNILLGGNTPDSDDKIDQGVTLEAASRLVTEIYEKSSRDVCCVETSKLGGSLRV